MEVNGPGSLPPSLPIKPASTQQPQKIDSSQPTKPIATDDQFEVSSAGRLMEQINQSAEMKQERIAQIKAAIEADTYETPEKLEAALGKFLDQYTSEDNS